jgi:hypothetical protein
VKSRFSLNSKIKIREIGYLGKKFVDYRHWRIGEVKEQITQLMANHSDFLVFSSLSTAFCIVLCHVPFYDQRDPDLKVFERTEKYPDYKDILKSLWLKVFNNIYFLSDVNEIVISKRRPLNVIQKNKA